MDLRIAENEEVETFLGEVSLCFFWKSLQSTNITLHQSLIPYSEQWLINNPVFLFCHVERWVLKGGWGQWWWARDFWWGIFVDRKYFNKKHKESSPRKSQLYHIPQSSFTPKCSDFFVFSWSISNHNVIWNSLLFIFYFIFQKCITLGGFIGTEML